MEDQKLITYAEVKERLKNVPLEQMSAQDTFDKCIGFGTYEDYNNTEVQKLLIKHNFAEWLIYGVSTIIKDKTVIEGILTSKLLKKNRYIIMKRKD